MTKGTPRASKPRKSVTKSPPKAGTKAKPGARGDKPLEPASRLVDQRIRDLVGWRGETLARMRALILEADPELTEEWKWMGTPVWSHHGIVCTGEAYTKVVKLTFARGGPDPRPIAPLQFQLGRQHAKGDGHPRTGEGRRGRVQGTREGRGRPEWPAG